MNELLIIIGLALIAASLVKIYRSGKKKDFYTILVAYGFIAALIVFMAVWMRSNG